MISPQGPSSFIPKSPTKSVIRPRGVRKIYVFTYLSLVLFFGTLIASAGTFFFDVTVNSQLDAQKEQLANERNAFNASDLERLKELELRINNANIVLDTHVSVADIFKALEISTLNTVQLTGIEYDRTEFGAISVVVNALARNLNDARFQRDVFAANETLRQAGIINQSYTSRDSQIGDDVARSEGQAIAFALSGGFKVADLRYQPDGFLVEEELTEETSMEATDELNDLEMDAATSSVNSSEEVNNGEEI